MEQHQKQNSIFEITLTPNNTKRLAALRGELDGNLRLIEKRLEVNIYSRDNHFTVKGHQHKPQIATRVLKSLYDETAASSEINSENVHLHLRQFESDKSILKGQIKDSFSNVLSVIRTKKGNIKPRGVNQNKYIQHIHTHDVNFGIGPAGTGKTYLAVACAVDALLKNQVERILLVRPAVEAGEKLGFLPGDLAQKVDPYLRPLYDALYEMLGHQTVIKLIERNTIEIAPLAYMRGRTLNNAFIILDEAQNTTREQMKMFLTRMGMNAKFMVTGDPGQVDLPKKVNSGLREAIKILSNKRGIKIIYLDDKDVIRHPIVKKVIDAYNNVEKDN